MLFVLMYASLTHDCSLQIVHALVYISAHLRHTHKYLHMCDCRSATHIQHHMYNCRNLAHCGTGGRNLHSAQHTRQYLDKQCNTHIGEKRGIVTLKAQC